MYRFIHILYILKMHGDKHIKITETYVILIIRFLKICQNSDILPLVVNCVFINSACYCQFISLHMMCLKTNKFLVILHSVYCISCCMRTKFCRGCPHHITGWAGLLNMLNKEISCCWGKEESERASQDRSDSRYCHIHVIKPLWIIILILFLNGICEDNSDACIDPVWIQCYDILCFCRSERSELCCGQSGWDI